MKRPRALDLFCGGFGAGYGYTLAGYDVTGVDLVERRDRPEGVEFIQADVLEILADVDYLRSFDLIHASPPCKVFTRLDSLVAAGGFEPLHGDLVAATRAGLVAAGVPFVIENVAGAPIRPDVILCGTMLGLSVVDSTGATRWLRRHRLFELGGWAPLGWGVQPEPCCSCWSGCREPMCGHRIAGDRPFVVAGHTLGDDIPGGGSTPETLQQARDLMGMPWSSWAAITQAIPPAYTRYLGSCAIEQLEGLAA